MCGFLYDVGEAMTDGVDAAGRAVSRGLGAVNNACNKANDLIEAIREMVVSSSDILADMIADSIVGQYWSDLWDLNVDSVNAIEGILEDTAEELANDEDVPGFIRDYMNGFIGADVPCNFFGMLGAGCRGVEEMLSGVYKGTSGVLGHPCQTEENIADALIIAGEATKYFIEDPKKATENAISSVSGWWNDKNTYEKIRTVVEAYIMYRMIASSRSKGETVTLESEEAAGAIDGVAGEAAEIAAEAGEVAEDVAKAGEVAEDAAKAGGKGKVKIESAGKCGNNSNQTLLSGEEWYRYFQDTYGVDYVNWNVSSFDDMLNHPTSLRGYSADEIGQILGDGWTRSTYGSNGSGWKFIENAHLDNMVFYHGGGGVHEGAYWGVKSGKTGTIKIVNTSTYVPLPKDKATIVYGKDW